MNENFDILVIGGGINGDGIVNDNDKKMSHKLILWLKPTIVEILERLRVLCLMLKYSLELIAV